MTPLAQALQTVIDLALLQNCFLDNEAYKVEHQENCAAIKMVADFAFIMGADGLEEGE